MGCLHNCTEKEFRCNNGNCIPHAYICDKDQDCIDGSDEDKCPVKNQGCQFAEHQCGKDGRCIPISWRCDHILDCEDQSDEIGCPGSESVHTNTTSVILKDVMPLDTLDYSGNHIFNQ